MYDITKKKIVWFYQFINNTMLTEKDYCDYETSRELKELGFVAGLGEGDCGYCLYDDAWHDQVNRPLLYEAQKWLREEKGIHISIDYDEFDWSYCLFDCSKKHYKQLSNCRMYFKSYEEALLNGIKVSVDFLKGE